MVACAHVQGVKIQCCLAHLYTDFSQQSAVCMAVEDT